VTTEALVAWCRERLPSFKIPRRVRFVESLPLSEGGKLLRTKH
jgi:acyl-CoA synthetase (AMP-forming)/AMP-acid ligase II